MADSNPALSILVTGGGASAGLATARALVKRGHKVSAVAGDAAGALALRRAGALPVYPDLCRASEALSALRQAKADAIVHAQPQVFGEIPHAAGEPAEELASLPRMSAALVEAAQAHGIKRVIALSFGYLYQTGADAAVEGDRDAAGGDLAPMLAAERCLRESDLNGVILRSGYIYGGHSAGSAALAQAIARSRRLPAGERPASWIHEDDLAAAIVALLEADTASTGINTLNAADDSPRSPNAFATALASAIGLSAPSFGSRPFARLRRQTLGDSLLGREITLNCAQLKARCGWTPRHGSIKSGLDATALTWRLREAVNADDYYNDYADEAAAAIANFAYDVALPAAVAEETAPAPAPAAAPAAAAAAPETVTTAAPPPSAGPTPWNEDDAKREERRRKALERKAKRAARQSRG